MKIKHDSNSLRTQSSQRDDMAVVIQTGRSGYYTGISLTQSEARALAQDLEDWADAYVEPNALSWEELEPFEFFEVVGYTETGFRMKLDDHLFLVSAGQDHEVLSWQDFLSGEKFRRVWE